MNVNFFWEIFSRLLNIQLFRFIHISERVHDPNSNLEAQRAILNRTPEKLSEYLSI